MGLVSWVALLKNLRGVVFFSGEPDPAKIKWLAKKHRYRRLGLPPSLASRAIPELRAAPFVPLSFPFGELEGIAELLSKEHRPEVVEALLLSCCYCSPLVVLDPLAAEDLRPFVLWERRTSQALSDKDLIFHLRVASYAILDFFPLAEEVLECWGRGGDLEELVPKRQRLAEADGRKRFWRIGEDPKGRPICSYLDLLPQFLRVGGATADLLASEAAALAFPITCAFFLGEVP